MYKKYVLDAITDYEFFVTRGVFYDKTTSCLKNKDGEKAGNL